MGGVHASIAVEPCNSLHGGGEWQQHNLNFCDAARQERGFSTHLGDTMYLRRVWGGLSPPSGALPAASDVKRDKKHFLIFCNETGSGSPAPSNSNLKLLGELQT